LTCLSRQALHEAQCSRRLLPTGKSVSSDEEARSFIDCRGFTLLAPVKGLPLPSLSEADAGDMWTDCPITDRAWAWKETLPAQKACAYGKLFHGRGTFISWRLYPRFVALYGPAGDLDEEYEAGRLSRADRVLVELVSEYGPIDSRNLWRRSRAAFGERHRFTAALDRLQARFFLTVAGGSLEGWTLHTWDLVERQAPAGLLARLPRSSDARRDILKQTVDNCVALSHRQLSSILRWPRGVLDQTLQESQRTGLLAEVWVEGERSPCFTLGQVSWQEGEYLSGSELR